MVRPMPSKRQILDLLTRPELQEVADRYQLTVPDRRVNDQLVDAATGSRKVVLADVLSAYTRDRLKELCSALGVDDGGREKAVLVERLTGQSAPAQPANGSNARTNGKTQGAADPAPVLGTGKLSREQLERYLWSAADILRGSIDSSDYKNFIFGLLFLKRLSDRFDEECEALSQRPATTPRTGRARVLRPQARPLVARSRRSPPNLGERLNKACRALEEENHSARGRARRHRLQRRAQARRRQATATRCSHAWSSTSRSLNLRNANLSEPDMLGRAYEYLIEKFADDAGKKGGEFYTPRMVVQLIVELLAPTEGMRICDPTCGSGGMLIECAHYLERHGRQPAATCRCFGQEKNLGTWAICKMNMLLHGLAGRPDREGRHDPRSEAGRRTARCASSTA